MNRREFLGRSAALGATLSVAAAIDAASETTSSNEGPMLTSIAYNILACRGFPDTKGQHARLSVAQADMPERLALELALYKPEIVTFSESPSREIVGRIASALQMNFEWFQGGWPGNEEYPGGFPGTIMSPFPIRNAQNAPMADGGARPEDLFTRHWCRATVDLDSGPLEVFSAHLHPSDAAVREREVTEILKVLAPEIAAGRSFLLQGDLNHKPDGPEYTRWLKAGLVDTFTRGQQPLYPFTVPSTKPRARIDYVWAHGPLAARIADARVLFEGGFRTNPDDPNSFALSDHVPILAEFRLE